MSAVATDQGTVLDGPEPQLFGTPEETLEDQVLGVWDELVATGRSRCPVCHGILRMAGGCEDCGAELS